MAADARVWNLPCYWDTVASSYYSETNDGVAQ